MFNQDLDKALTESHQYLDELKVSIRKSLRKLDELQDLLSIGGDNKDVRTRVKTEEQVFKKQRELKELLAEVSPTLLGLMDNALRYEQS